MTEHNENYAAFVFKTGRRLILGNGISGTSLTKGISGTYVPTGGLAGANERVNLACVGIGNQGRVRCFFLIQYRIL